MQMSLSQAEIKGGGGGGEEEEEEEEGGKKTCFHVFSKLNNVTPNLKNLSSLYLMRMKGGF